MDTVITYLQNLGFEEKQAEIFLKTYQYGPKPASTIAKLCKTERSYTYKVLEKLEQQHLCNHVIIKGTKHFYIESPDVLLQKVKEKKQQASKLEKGFHEIKSAFLLLDEEKIPYVPKVSQFAGIDGIKNRYHDIIEEIDKQELLIIKYVVTDLFESQVTQFSDLQDTYQDFLIQIQNKNIHINGLLGNGSLVVENFLPINSRENNLGKLSVGNQSMQIRIVGKNTYVGIFRETPIGLKIASPDLADLRQIMIEQMVQRKEK